MPLKDIILKFISKVFITCIICSVFLFAIYRILFGNNSFSEIVIIISLYTIIFSGIMFIVYIIYKNIINDNFKTVNNKTNLILERLKFDDDFSAIITDISEIDNLVIEMQEKLSKENLDFSDLNGEKKSIAGVFKLNYNTNKFIFSTELAEFFYVNEYSVEGNIAIADINAYYDFSKNIGKSFSGNEDNLYYEDTPEGRKWFNIFMNYQNNCGYGFIVDSTDRIISDDFNKIKTGKSYSSSKFYSADVMMEILRKNIKDNNDLKGCLISAELTLIRNINEYYGYNTGNSYIKICEKAILESFNEAIIGKKSAFEYYIFIYSENNNNLSDKIEDIFNSIYDNNIFTAPDGKEFKIKFNVGYSIYPRDTNSLEILFKYSAYALYEAKKIYNVPINSFSLRNYNNDAYMELKFEKLDSLIRNNDLCYVFQPIISLSDGSVIAYEALMHPQDKIFVSPYEVIELIKNRNLSYRFEKLTVYNCLEIVAQNKSVFKNRRLLYNTIGIDNLKFEDVAIMRDKYEDVGHILVPEVAETENIASVLKKCVEIHETGDKFAIDCFTAKTEGFENIFRIKPTYVKIDRSLIIDVGMKPKAQAFLANLVRIAKNHDVPLIAVGVETSGELRELIRLGIDFAQGYYIAKPQNKFIEKIESELIDEIVKCNGVKR